MLDIPELTKRINFYESQLKILKEYRLYLIKLKVSKAYRSYLIDEANKNATLESNIIPNADWQCDDEK